MGIIRCPIAESIQVTVHVSRANEMVREMRPDLTSWSNKLVGQPFETIMSSERRERYQAIAWFIFISQSVMEKQTEEEVGNVTHANSKHSVVTPGSF
jgi:hypothetical protein